MWLFLGTEVLLFAGLFLGYTVYRHFYPEAFHHASRALDLTLGTINTLVLITSSFTVALAYYAVKVGKNKLALGMLVFTILCACAFLVIKYFEYAHKFHVGDAARASGSRIRGADEVSGREPVLHRLLPGHRPARVPRHRRHVGADLGG